MKSKLSFIVILLFNSLIFAQVPKFEVELKDEAKIWQTFENDKYIFLSTYEYSYLYDLESGNKIYELRLKDYEKIGLHNVIGNYFIISVNNELHCYDILTGKQLWKQKYDKIDQDDFLDYDFVENNMIIRYDEVHIGINLNDGAEKFRFVTKYNKDLKNAGGWNWTSIKKYKYLLIFDDDDNLLLYNYADGKQALKIKDYEVNTDVVKKYNFFYKTKDEKYITVTLDKAISIVDLENLKEIYRVDVKYDLDYSPIIPTEFGFLYLVKNKIMVFNQTDGKLTETAVDVSSFKTYYLTKVNDKNLLIVSLEDQMLAIDLTVNKLLWISKKDDPNFAGYAHRYLKTDGENIIFTAAAKGTKFSLSSPGTDLFVISLNALTGKINYKSKAVFHSWKYFTAFERGITKLVGNISDKVKVLDYSKIPFEYLTYIKDNKLVIAVATSQKMEIPDKGDEGGEGIAIVDINNGNILYSDYLQLSSYPSFSPNKYSDMPPYLQDNIVVVCGDKKIAAYDIDKMQRLVLSDEVRGLPREAFIIDKTLYIKFGEYKFKIKISPPKNIFQRLNMEIDKQYNEDPYGFIAFDLTNGKKLWRIETDVDPAFQSFNFSMKNNYDPKRKRLYFADEKKIYAVQFRPDGGKYDYVLDLGDLKLGKMPLDETYVIMRWKIISTWGSSGFGYFVYASESNYAKALIASRDADSYIEYQYGYDVWAASAFRRLGFVINDDKMLIMSTKAIGQYEVDGGKEIWKIKWDYNQKDFQYPLEIINNRIVYCLDRELKAIDINSGKITWENKEAKSPIFQPTSTGKYLIVIDEDNIRVYNI